MAGIGWQSTRFYGYEPTSSCVYYGACYQSSNHFLVDVGSRSSLLRLGSRLCPPGSALLQNLQQHGDFSSGNVIPLGSFNRIHYRRPD